MVCFITSVGSGDLPPRLRHLANTHYETRYNTENAAREVERLEQEAALARQRAAEAQWRIEEDRRLWEAERIRIEEEKRAIEAVRIQADHEKWVAEEERRRADEEQRRIQEAKARAEMEKRIADEARIRAEDEKRRAEIAMAKAEEERRKAESEARETKRRAEESARIAEAERKGTEEKKRMAEEGRQRAEKEKRLAEETAAKAMAIQVEAGERAVEAQRRADSAKASELKALDELRGQVSRIDELEGKRLRGDRPVVSPTEEDIKSAKIRFGYTEGRFHFAIAGLAGSGKSSLINAFRGLTNNDPRAANTGIVETTLQVTGYPDPDPKNPFVWYDVPGAGTLEIPDWQYFNAQELFVFDRIIVLIDNRFSATDIAILENCKRFNIPSYIVRSKADQHVLNIMTDMGYNLMVDDGIQHAQMLPAARAKFLAETRGSVKANLGKAGLPPQRVYVVSKDTMVEVVHGRSIGKDRVIDEVQLFEDILKESTHTGSEQMRE